MGVVVGKFLVSGQDLAAWLSALREYRESWREAALEASELPIRVADFLTPERVLLRASKRLAEELGALTRDMPWTIAAHPLMAYLLGMVLEYVAADKEPVARVVFTGPPGTGKTTLAFWLIALLYGMSRGLCKPLSKTPLGKIAVRRKCTAVKVGAFRLDLPCLHFAEPPAFDCPGLAPHEAAPPPQWAFLRQVVLTVTDIAPAAKTLMATNDAMRRGESVALWAWLFDEGGAGAMGAAMFHVNRKMYAAASVMVQLIRTFAPFFAVTVTDVNRLGVALREIITHAVYIDPCSAQSCPGLAWEELPHFVIARVDERVPVYGPAESPRTFKVRGRIYLPASPALQLPAWMYKEHLEARAKVVEYMLERLEGFVEGEETEEEDDVRKLVQYILHKASKKKPPDDARPLAEYVKWALDHGMLRDAGIWSDPYDIRITVDALRNAEISATLADMAEKLRKAFAERGLDCTVDVTRTKVRHIRVPTWCFHELLDSV